MARTISLLTGAAAAALLASASAAAAQEVTLTIHHFLGPTAPAQADFLEPWAERIAEASEGRIAIEIFPSMSLGGRPPELYGQARDGVADIVWTLLGYTPGAFPRTEVFELPTVHRGSAEATSQAIQDVMDLVGEDFADTHPLLIYAHAGQALFMVDEPVRSLDDVRGKKLRIPSRSGAMLIEAWGAEPVGMPVPELPQALSRGAVDGAMIPYEIALPLRVHELVGSVTLGEDGRRFGTSVFVFTMNKERYESLPDDLKAVIDAHSGAHLAQEAGRVWDVVEQPGIDAMTAAGNEIIELSAKAQTAFDAKAEAVEERWIAEANALGLDGAALVAAAKEAVARYAE
jgi:TRAP-type C4-dicarboxylate transport system substrate-binding protein